MIQDLPVTDFRDPLFAEAFTRYFSELGIKVRDWERLWDEMNRSGCKAGLRLCNDRVIGFIQYQPILSESSFFEERLGFIRELWIEPDHRRQGHGTALLALAEEACRAQGVVRMILTTDTAAQFYLQNGYRKRPDIAAKNRLCVYEKLLSE